MQPPPRPRIQGRRVGCPHLRGSRITDPFGHHPDDRAGNAVDRHDRAQYGAVAAETPLPQTPAENDQAVFARLVLARHERASQRWTQSECFEVVGRDLHALHALWSLAAGDVAGPPYVRHDVVEALEVHAPIVEIGCRDFVVIIAAGSDLPQRHEPVRRLKKRIRAKQQVVHRREDRGVGADTEGERPNGDGGERGIRGQGPERVAKVLEQGVHSYLSATTGSTRDARRAGR